MNTWFILIKPLFIKIACVYLFVVEEEEEEIGTILCAERLCCLSSLQSRTLHNLQGSPVRLQGRSVWLFVQVGLNRHGHDNIIKLLGIFIEADLKLGTHFSRNVKWANSRWYLLRKLKYHLLASNDLVTIFTSFVHPVLEYGDSVWLSGITKQQF